MVWLVNDEDKAKREQYDTIRIDILTCAQKLT